MPSHAITDDEINNRLKLAIKAENDKKYDQAIKHYLYIFQNGSGWGTAELSLLYSEKINDYRKAALWCLVAYELIYPQNFTCDGGYDGKFNEDELLQIRRLAVQCISTQYKYCENLDQNKFKNEIDLYYSKYCKVNDPTGTELNVRSSPNGSVSFQLENGWDLIIYKTVKDKNNKEWALVISPETAADLGWVFKNYLKCNTRQRL